MRALFLTRKFLGDGEEPVTGTYKRMGLFLEAVSRIATHVELVVFAAPGFQATADEAGAYRDGYSRWMHCPFILHLLPRDPPYRPKRLLDFAEKPWSLYSRAVHSYHTTSSPAHVDAVRQLLAAGPDLVFVHRLVAMAPLLRGKMGHPALFLDLDDVEHRGFVRNVLAPPHYLSRYLQLLHTPPLVLGERQALRAARRTYVCSSTDRDYLRRLYRADGVEDIPNSVTIPPPSPVPATPTLLFLGSAAFEPNLVAADWLTTEVWPRVRAAVPDAILTIAGEFPERFRAHGAPVPGVELAGFVQDLDGLYARTRIVTCPILSGSGTRFKIVEAAAYGRPVVSTRLGAEGLSFTDGASILLRDGPAAFAGACIELLQDHGACTRLAAGARRLAEQDYDRDRVIRRIMASMEGAMGGVAATAGASAAGGR